MSGRAGRRGIDSRGVVIIQVDEQIPAAVLKSIIKVSFRNIGLTIRVLAHYRQRRRYKLWGEANIPF